MISPLFPLTFENSLPGALEALTSYKVGNWPSALSLRRETAAAGPSFPASTTSLGWPDIHDPIGCWPERDISSCHKYFTLITKNKRLSLRVFYPLSRSTFKVSLPSWATFISTSRLGVFWRPIYRTNLLLEKIHQGKTSDSSLIKHIKTWTTKLWSCKILHISTTEIVWCAKIDNKQCFLSNLIVRTRFHWYTSTTGDKSQLVLNSKQKSS